MPKSRFSKDHPSLFAAIPMQFVGPIKINSVELNEDILLPIATFESPLWPSLNRGARVTSEAGGIKTVLIDERMSRSILLEADSVDYIKKIYQNIQLHRIDFERLSGETSRFARFVDCHIQIVGSLFYLRLEFTTGDAAGHNMVTLAAERILNWLLVTYPELRYVSISGNYCSDKKVSAVNGLLGRGKYVVAEVIISRSLCRRFLKTTPEKIIDLNIKKNLMGNILAGGLRTANAHFANILLGFYLATGQDAANIIEGSQGMVYAEMRSDELYFSVTLPNLIVGTVGNGKHLQFVQDNLNLLGLTDSSFEPGHQSRRLAMMAAAAVLCGELSLLAAQTNQGELMRSHLKLERHSKQELSRD